MKFIDNRTIQEKVEDHVRDNLKKHNPNMAPEWIEKKVKELVEFIFSGENER